MKQGYTHLPVILLLDGNAIDNDCVKEWFKTSRFLTSETVDIFQALEEISDFTVRCRPDVVLLEVNSLTEDFFTVRKMVQTSSGECGFPIFALSDSGKIINHKECFEGNLTQLKTQLNKMIPELAHVRAA